MFEKGFKVSFVKNRVFFNCEILQNLFIFQTEKVLTSKREGKLPQLSVRVTFDPEKWEIVKQPLTFSVYSLPAEM